VTSVERWLRDPRQPVPSARDLAMYIEDRVASEYPLTDEERDLGITECQPPNHDWMRRAALALAKATRIV